MHSKSLGICATVLFSLGTACSSANVEEVPDDLGAEGIVKPTGQELMGSLLVESPKEVRTLRPGLSTQVRAAIVEPGRGTIHDQPLDEVRRVREWSGCLEIRDEHARGFGGTFVTRHCDVAVTRGQTTTATVSAIWLDTEVALDFPRWQESRLYQAGFDPDRASTSHVSRRRGLFVVAPGEYRYRVRDSVYEEFAVHAAPSQITKVTLPDRTAKLTIRGAERHLPNAPFEACQGGRIFLLDRTVENRQIASAPRYAEPTWFLQRCDRTADGDDDCNSPKVRRRPGRVMTTTGELEQTQGVVHWAYLDGIESRTYTLLPFAAAEAPRHYELVAHGVPETITLEPGEEKTIELRRIDVTDVEVVDEAGNLTEAKGTWYVERKTDDGWKRFVRNGGCGTTKVFAPPTYPTGTGIDVLPGVYRVVVRYQTKLGWQEQEHIVDES
jgi:hypothetical protein